MENLFDSLLDLTAKSTFLKASEVAFHESTNIEFRQEVSGQRAKIQELLKRILNNFQKEQLDKIDHVKISDTVDHLLEKADVQMDISSGKLNKNIIIQESSLSVIRHATQLSKPQLKFKDAIDNSNTPFVSKLTVKVNAKRALDYDQSSDISNEMVEHLKSIHSSIDSHPYEFEISNLSYPSRMFVISPEILYNTMEKTPFTWVETEIQLENLAKILDGCKEISVDLEHHDLRSYQGFTCLIQISTRQEDYVVDALALRHHLQILNSSFTNPDIVKVFHGADSDIQWLQRDFGVYIVNLFDTYHASHVLGLQGHGLAFLLKHYCNVITDKRFQRADWRLRPIPADMLFYARSDTHYLLYIYDRMRNEIIENSDKDTLNLMNIALSRSASTSLKIYKKEIYDAEIGDGPNGWKTMLRKISINMKAEKLSVYRALHAWRDQKAREADESIHYVLPNHMLFNLVEALPSNSQQTLACCSPIPNFVRMYSTEIVSLIDTARQEAIRNLKAREEELQKLKADLELKDREFAKRKLEGPVHIRFDKEVEKKEGESEIDLLLNASESSHIDKKFKTRVRVRFINESGLLGRCLEAVEPPSLFEKAMDLNNKMKLEISSISVKAPAELTPATKEAPQVETPIENSSIIEDSIPSSKLKTDFITIDEEQIEIVANVGKEGKKGKNRKRSKKKSRYVESTIEENIAFKEKSVIALELEKMDQEI